MCYVINVWCIQLDLYNNIKHSHDNVSICCRGVCLDQMLPLLFVPAQTKTDESLRAQVAEFDVNGPCWALFRHKFSRISTLVHG